MDNPDLFDEREEIAIVGMTGRFPGAGNVDQFWRNLRDGIESITFFSDEELQAAGVAPALLSNPDYVKAEGILEDIDKFDAAFFGYNPKEAALLDPQQRLFLECAWEALELAGYDSETFDGRIGVYAGVSMNHYLRNIYTNREALNLIDGNQITISNDKDFLPTRVSYKLNLKGPSINVQTACSTSLVAVCLAAQSLLNGECDMALAGGVAVKVPQKRGYLYHEGGIFSPDGHCRAFDAKAAGTVGGRGAGIVVLKRLADARRDRDTIHAVIKGFAINNDGSDKIGYTAPSVRGQAECIAEALAMAAVEADTITYIETHGTGTQLGDPIEAAGLKAAFAGKTTRQQFCAVGTVKSNIGHLDTAAGVAGLIKTVLSLKHGEIPASLHYERDNEKAGFAGSPFYVNGKLKEWEVEEGGVRRAGVSSFGIGGTNAHVIVEEWKEAEEGREEERGEEWEVMVVSGKTKEGMEEGSRRLKEELERGGKRLKDVAYTLAAGRRAFNHRRVVICNSTAEAVRALETNDPRMVFTRTVEAADRSIIFMFPGGGAQYANMGLDLYGTEALFREQIDLCAQLLKPHLNLDLKDFLYPAPERSEELAPLMKQTATALPALFVIEYALAKLLISWGIRPVAMIGHSLGEYVAACLAGVFSLEDALSLVATRGRLFEQLPRGAMLTATLSEDELRPLLDGRYSIAALNGPQQSVVSGSSTDIDEMAGVLTGLGVEHRRIHIDVAAHSAMVEPILASFAQQVERIKLKPPRLPYLSNVTGRWITADEATQAAYWVRHLRQTVRFSDGIRELLKSTNPTLIEVGPGQTLSVLTRLHTDNAQTQTVLSTMRHPQDQRSDVAVLLTTVGKLWLAGVPLDAGKLYQGQDRRRVPLPTYPFEKKSYWIGPLNNGRAAATANAAHGATRGAARGPRPTSESRKRGSMSSSKLAASQQAKRRDHIASFLTGVVQTFTGLDVAEISPQMTFLEMGADSLTLLRASQVIQNKLGIKIPFRQLVTEFSTIETLAEHIDRQLPASQTLDDLVPQPAPPQAATEPEAEPIEEDWGQLDQPAAEQFDRSDVQATAPPARVSLPQAGLDPLTQLFAQQLQIISHQLEILGNQKTARRPEARPAPVRRELETVEREPEAINAAPLKATSPPPLAGQSEPEPYVAYQPVAREASSGLTAQQQAHLDGLIARVVSRTGESKRIAQSNRHHLADNRPVAGFRLLWKEMFYPIVAQRAQGARMWDVDGNEYVDLTMGFGSLLFGHSPAFVTEAIETWLSQGIQLGPQSRLAGDVARLFCELTGKERAAFCNSGTEAVMTALRLARTRTGRDKIALFSGCYHGGSDGVLVRAERTADGKLRAVPMAPGIPAEVAQNAVILAYNSQESLETLKGCLHELAAVIIEPLPSRRPDARPIAFLQELRRLTEAAGTALIFDEVVTGFRMHLRGAQGLFGVEADIATYGKAVGAGLPIGVVAGKAAFLDGVDGGMWTYGDDSYPREETTFYAGTFFKHPLVMAAAWAALNHIKQRGPQLQEELNQKTAALVRTLNAFFLERGAPVQASNFGSLFRFIPLPEFKYIDLFYYHLLEQGVYIWEGRNCYLSTAHTDADIEHLIRAVKHSVVELQAGGFLPRRDLDTPSGDGLTSTSLREAVAGSAGISEDAAGVITAPTTEGQKQVWIGANLGDEATRAYNESITLHLRGPLNLEAMRAAVQKVVDRQQSLRTSFSPDGETQQIAPRVSLFVPYHDFLHLEPSERSRRQAEWINGQVGQVFDLTTAPLMRVEIARLETDYHLLVLTVHHIVTDGYSTGIVLQEFKGLYEAECLGRDCTLPEPVRFSDYIRKRTTDQGPAIERAERYWLGQFEQAPPTLELPLDRPRPPVKTYAGARRRIRIDASISRGIKKLSAQQGCTVYMALLAGYKTLLHLLSDQSDLVVGISSADQSASGDYLVGYCVNVLALRTRIDQDETFAGYLKQVRKILLDAYENQTYPYGRLLGKLNLRRDPSRSPLITAYFNLDRPAGSRLKFHDLEAEVVANPSGYARWDVTWNIVDEKGEIDVEAIYNCDLFDAQTIDAWIRRYETILQAAIAQPHERLSLLKQTLAEGERRRRMEKAKEFEKADLQMLKKINKSTTRQGL